MHSKDKRDWITNQMSKVLDNWRKWNAQGLKDKEDNGQLSLFDDDKDK